MRVVTGLHVLSFRKITSWILSVCAVVWNVDLTHAHTLLCLSEFLQHTPQCLISSDDNASVLHGIRISVRVENGAMQPWIEFLHIQDLWILLLWNHFTKEGRLVFRMRHGNYSCLRVKKLKKILPFATMNNVCKPIEVLMQKI